MEHFQTLWFRRPNMLVQLTIWESDTLVDVAGSNPIIFEPLLKNWKMNEDGFRKRLQNLNWERICTFANNDFRTRCKIQLVTQNIIQKSEQSKQNKPSFLLILNLFTFLGLQWNIGKLWIHQLADHFPQLWVFSRTHNAFSKEFWSKLCISYYWNIDTPFNSPIFIVSVHNPH